MNKELFREALEKIKGHLPEYLEEHDIDTTYQFSCIHPDHADGNPSMGILAESDNKNFNCLGCGATGDIFTAANYLEDKPLLGPAWISENVKYLADKYDIDLPQYELSEDDLYELETYKAYKLASEYIATRENGDYKLFDKEMKKRKWDDKTLSELLVGTVNSQDYIKHMKSLGFTAKFLGEIDLARKDIFNSDHMVFTVCDEYGRPCGFAARNLTYVKGDKSSGIKYVNQKTTGAKCNIYKKGSRLYGLHRALKHSPPLYIFEGYSDVITAIHSGIKNVCCIGGTAFTADHVFTLKDSKQYDIILAFDSDKPGQDKTQKILDEKLAGHRDMKVRLLNFPDGQDPDDFIRENGASEFYSLTKYDAFTWRLERYDDLVEDPQDICDKMIPFIVNEANHCAKEIMVNTLSMHTGVSSKSIWSELNRLDNVQDAEMEQERNLIVDKMNKELRRNPESTQHIISMALNQIDNVSRVYNLDNFSQDNWIDSIRATKEKEETESDEDPGFLLPGMPLFEKVMKGPWRQDVFLCIGGSPNTGKTAIMANLAYNIAAHNKDVCVIFHTIDDSINQFLPRLICIAGEDPTLEMNHVMNPVYFNGPDELGIRERGYKKVMSLAQEGKLIVKDSSAGNSLAYGESLVKYYQDQFPDRQIVYFLDNFHKLNEAAGMSEKDERIKIKQFSHYVKNNIAVKYHIPVIATVEYTKLEQTKRPTNNNVAESVSIEYDCNFMAHLYNDQHAYGAQAKLYHRAFLRGEEQRLPRIEMAIGKNKITSYKDKLYFDFFPASSMYRCCERSTAEDDLKSAEAISTQHVQNAKGATPGSKMIGVKTWKKN